MTFPAAGTSPSRAPRTRRSPSLYASVRALSTTPRAAELPSADKAVAVREVRDFPGPESAKRGGYKASRSPSSVMPADWNVAPLAVPSTSATSLRDKLSLDVVISHKRAIPS